MIPAFRCQFLKKRSFFDTKRDVLDVFGSSLRVAAMTSPISRISRHVRSIARLIWDTRLFVCVTMSFGNRIIHTFGTQFSQSLKRSFRVASGKRLKQNAAMSCIHRLFQWRNSNAFLKATISLRVLGHRTGLWTGEWSLPPWHFVHLALQWYRFDDVNKLTWDYSQ